MTMEESFTGTTEVFTDAAAAAREREKEREKRERERESNRKKL